MTQLHSRLTAEDRLDALEQQVSDLTLLHEEFVHQVRQRGLALDKALDKVLEEWSTQLLKAVRGEVKDLKDRVTQKVRQ